MPKKNRNLVPSTYFTELIKKAKELSHNYPLKDAAETEKFKLENTRLLDNQYAYIFDLVSYKPIAVVNTKKAIGYDESYFTDLSKLLDLLVPEDAYEIARLSLASQEFYKFYENEFRAGNFATAIHFHRICAADKQVFWAMRQTYIIYADEETNAIINCSVVTLLKDNPLGLHAMQSQYLGHRGSEFNQFVKERFPEYTEKPILSPREIEVIKHVNEGATSVEIAQKLSISVLTVRKHRANILHKLGLSNTAQLVTYAKKAKLG